MGLAGRLLDRRIVRPALGWATALSFDRLRLWAETGQDPAVTLLRWGLDAAARVACVAAVGAAVVRSQRKYVRTKPLLVGAAVAAALAAVMVPAHRTVPRAGRCLRTPPGRQEGHAPSSLSGLPQPSVAAEGSAA